MPTTSKTTEEAALAITREGAKWGGAIGTGATVTFAFRRSIDEDYESSDEHAEGATFLGLNAAQRHAVFTALDLWSDLANLNFALVTDPGQIQSNDATMLFGSYFHASDASAAFALLPGDASAGSRAGDVWLNRNTFSTNLLNIGSRDFMVVLHEIGHAIGLSHPGDYNAAPGVTITYDTHAGYVEDTNRYSLMSYFEVMGQPESPLLHDIAAIQRLYGANLGTRTGDDTYGFNSTIGGRQKQVYDFTLNTSPNIAIYDAGGIDTFDVSGFSQQQRIDLRPGFFSSVGWQHDNVAMSEVVRNPQGQVVNLIENAVGGNGNDTLTGNEASNVLEGGRGADWLDGNWGFDYASYARAAGGLRVSLQAPGLNTGAAAGDVFFSIEGLVGSAFGDHLTGDGNANILHDGGGNDRLEAGAGSLGDTLYGETGSDTMLGGDRADLFHGGSGFDLVSYENAAQAVLANFYMSVSGWPSGGGAARGDGYIEVEALRGSRFDDTLNGSSRNDRLEGGNGADSLDGSLGNDTLQGDEGDDILRGGSGSDSMNGGAGIDTADYSFAAGPVRAALSAITAALWPNLGDAAGDSFRLVENLRGSAHDDTLQGDAGANRLEGGAGWDRLTGGSGNDTYDLGEIHGHPIAGRVWDEVTELAGGGFDTVLLRASANPLLPWSIVPTAYYTLGAEVEAAEAQGGGNFTLVGSILDNRLLGSIGDDRLVAGDGADTLGGGAGADTLFGEFGDDTYLLTDVTSDTGPWVSPFATRWDSVLEPVGGGTDTVILVAAPHPTVAGMFVASYTLGAQIENGAVWDSRDFTLVGNVLDNALWGGDGHDRMVAGDGADTLSGGAGADTLFGEFGDDTYVLRDVATPPVGPGHFAMERWDLVLEAAGGGTDTVLVERARRDGFFESWRTDHTLADFVENGRVTGTEAFTLTGNVLANVLTGNDAFNFLVGQDGNDTIEGRGGDDALNGGHHADRLNGGAGADTLDGAAGRDTLTGGTEADIFVFGAPPPAGEGDAVTDFLSGVDSLLLALSGFDPGGALGLVAGSLADQAGRFAANLTGLAEQHGVAQVIYETDAGRLWWDADGLGGAARQFVASLGGLPAIQAGDILFA